MAEGGVGGGTQAQQGGDRGESALVLGGMPRMGDVGDTPLLLLGQRKKESEAGEQGKKLG